MKLNLSNNKKNENNNVHTAQVNNQVIAAAAAGPAVDAEAVEVKDEPKTKAKKTAKASKAAPKKTAAPKKSDKQTSKAAYHIQEYTTKKGGTAYLLFGFETKEQAENIAAQCSKTISASWRTGENGEKRFCLSMGTRYGDVAKAMCDALNAKDGTALATAMADSCKVYDKAVADGKAEREAKKQERAEAKAVKAAEKTKGAAKSSKSYSDKEVAAMLSKIMSGGDIPESVRKHMKMSKAA